jgi:hypothetical protein
MPLGGFRLNGLGKLLSTSEYTVIDSVTSLTQSITIPSTVVPGDGLIIFEMSDRTYGDFEDGWSMPRSTYANNLRASIINKIAVTGDANKNVIIPQGDATFIELIMLVIRKNVSTTAMSVNNISANTGVNSASNTTTGVTNDIVFARYASLNASSISSANSNFTEYTSSSRSAVRVFAPGSGFSVSMTASGACILQTLSISLS